MRPDVNRQVQLAEERTVLAAERTYAAWLRTGLAFLAAGLALEHFVRESALRSPLVVISVALTVCAVACFAAAAWRQSEVRRRLGERHVRFLPQAFAIGMPALLVVVSVVATVLFWTR